MTPEQWKIYNRLLLVDPPKVLAAYKDLETIDFDVSFDEMRAASRATPLPPYPVHRDLEGQALRTPASPPRLLPATLEKAWTTGQNELAQLLPTTPHRIATESSHYVQIEAPQLVIDAIRQVVEAARAGSRRADLRQIQGLNDSITPRPHGAFLCAPANWLRRLDLATLICGKPRHVRAGTAATQPLSSRARSRQALCLVPLRAEPEAAILRRVACRHRTSSR